MEKLKIITEDVFTSFHGFWRSILFLVPSPQDPYPDLLLIKLN